MNPQKFILFLEFLAVNNTFHNKIVPIYSTFNNDNIISFGYKFWDKPEISIINQNLTIVAITNVTREHEKLFIDIAEKSMKFKAKFLWEKSLNVIRNRSYNESVHILLFAGLAQTQYLSLPPLLATSHQLIFALPFNANVSSTYFLALFHPLLWMTITCIYIILDGFILIFKIFNNLNFNQYLEAVFHTIGISSERVSFSRFSLNYCIIIYSFLFNIIAVSFSAFLITELSVRENELPFHNLSDLANQSHYKICVKKDMHSRNKLESEKGYENVIDDKICSPILDKYESTEVLNPLCANINTTLLIPSHKSPLNKIRDMPCNIVRLKQEFYPVYSTFLIGPNFPYKNQFRIFITKMKTSGILFYLYKNSRPCEFKNEFVDNEIIEVRFYHIFVILSILVGIYISSIILLLMEMITYKYSRRNLDDSNQRLFFPFRM